MLGSRALAVVGLCALVAAAGCATAGGPSLAGSMMGQKTAARRSKGDGTRRTVIGTRAEIEKAFSDQWKDQSDFSIQRGEDSIGASMDQGSVHMSWLVYFYPAPAPDKTELELLVSMAYLEQGKLSEMENKMIDGLAERVELERYRRGGKPAPAASSSGGGPSRSASEESSPATVAEPAKPAEKPKPAPKPSAALDNQL